MKVGGGTLFLLAHALWSLSFGAPKLAAAPGELLDIIPRLIGSVRDLELDGQGRVYVAGSFIIEGESEKRTLIRLLPDGSLDPSFNITVGTGEVRAVHHHSGKLLVGGTFATLNSNTALAGIARLNLDGSVDPTFKPPRFSAPFFPSGGGVQRIHATATGDILVMGSFESLEQSISATGLLRLDPTGLVVRRDGWIAKPTAQSGLDALFLESMPGGRTVFGGASYRINSQLHGGIVEIDGEGELTPRFVWATNLLESLPPRPSEGDVAGRHPGQGGHKQMVHSRQISFAGQICARGKTARGVQVL